MNISFEKIASTVERDIRNQVTIDQMKKLNRKGKFMVLVNRHPFITGIIISLFLWTGIVFAAVKAFAVECPNRGPKRRTVEHALSNARDAHGRRLAERSTQATLLAGVAALFARSMRAASASAMASARRVIFGLSVILGGLSV